MRFEIERLSNVLSPISILTSHIYPIYYLISQYSHLISIQIYYLISQYSHLTSIQFTISYLNTHISYLFKFTISYLNTHISYLLHRLLRIHRIMLPIDFFAYDTFVAKCSSFDKPGDPEHPKG